LRIGSPQVSHPGSDLRLSGRSHSSSPTARTAQVTLARDVRAGAGPRCSAGSPPVVRVGRDEQLPRVVRVADRSLGASRDGPYDPGGFPVDAVSSWRLSEPVPRVCV
jgi:hypothetical protein